MADKKIPEMTADIENENFNIYLITILITIITFVIIFIYRRTRTDRRSVLLMGLCDSGKTLLYAQLLHSKFVQTQTSIKENVDEYLVNKKSLRVVDIPGHERLRGKFFDQYKTSARGIVYVIDSLTLQKEVRDVAEFLYIILTDSVVMSAAPRILILCNKQDEMLSKGANVIKTLLEKEMNTLRVTQSSQLESVDDSKKKKIFLGKEEKDFDFTAIPPYLIEFGESQANDTATNIETLKNWLHKLA